MVQLPPAADAAKPKSQRPQAAVPRLGRRHGRSVRVGAGRSAVGAGEVVEGLRVGAHGPADGGSSAARGPARPHRVAWCPGPPHCAPMGWGWSAASAGGRRPSPLPAARRRKGPTTTATRKHCLGLSPSGVPLGRARSPVFRRAPTPAACGAAAPMSRRVGVPTPAAPSCMAPRGRASPSGVASRSAPHPAQVTGSASGAAGGAGGRAAPTVTTCSGSGDG